MSVDAKTGTLFGDALRVFDVVCACPGVRVVIETLHKDPSFSLVLYGGAVLDVLCTGAVTNDLDFLLEYRGDSLEEANNQFIQLVRGVAEITGGVVTEYENDHIVIHSIPGGLPIDIHYPTLDVSLGLYRSEYTVNGIGYNCRKKEFFDPLGGIDDLKQGKLIVHSPAYVISGPSAFPRLYRTSLKLGVPLPNSVVSLIIRYAPMVSIHDGRTNLRVLIETLKIFSHPKGLSAIKGMIDHGLFRCMFPEISPLTESSFGTTSQNWSVKDNLSFVEASYLSTMSYSHSHKEFLGERLFSFDNVTRLGLLRFCILFLGLGHAYYQLKPNSPYERGIASDNPPLFIYRMERNILGFMVARYREHHELVRQLAAGITELPTVARDILPDSYAAGSSDKQRQFDPRISEVYLKWIRKG
jgi:hypothetical protein